MSKFKQVSVLLLVGMLPIFAYATTERVCYKKQKNTACFYEEYIPLKHLKASEISYFIQNNHMLSDKGKSNFDWRTNTLIITDTQAVAKTIKEFVKKVDKPINLK